MRSRLKEAQRQTEARRDHGVLVATYWRLSKTLATQSGLRRAEVASATQAGMTNQWLAEQGLVSIKPKRSEDTVPGKPSGSLFTTRRTRRKGDFRNRRMRTRMSGGVGSGS